MLPRGRSILTLTVDRKSNPAGAPAVANSLVISVKFPRGTQKLIEDVVDNVAGRTSPLPHTLLTKNCSSVQFILSEPVVVEGFGVPFSNPGHPSEGWLYRDEPIVGEVRLSGILAQEAFTFVVPNTTAKALEARLSVDELGPVFSYPYGQEHSWDPARYTEQHPDITGPAFPRAFTFSDDNEHVAALTQSQVQDVWWLFVASIDIASHWHPIYFVPLGDGHDRYYGLVQLPADFKKVHEDAWRRFLKDGSLQLNLRDRIVEPEATATWDARVVDYPAGKPQLRDHKVDDKLVLMVWRTRDEKKGSDFPAKVFETGKEASEALKQGPAF